MTHDLRKPRAGLRNLEVGHISNAEKVDTFGAAWPAYGQSDDGYLLAGVVPDNAGMLGSAGGADTTQDRD